jgi:uncharacterized protein YejL (UPF0352 family)
MKKRVLLSLLRVLPGLVLLAMLGAGSAFAQKPDYSVYQSQIQRACGLTEPARVWALIEQHKFAGDLYKNLATNMTMALTIDDCKAVIQARCKFSGPADVWAALDKHRFPNDLYRVLAQGLVGNREQEKTIPLKSTGSKYNNYQTQIQKVCKFSDDPAVWAVIEQHKFVEDLYKNLASNLTKTLTREDCKAVIQARCKFSGPADVWAVLDKHPSADILYRKIAQGLVGK